MIIKIKSYKRPSFGKLLKYIQDDNKRISGKETLSFTLTYNLKGKTIKDWERQFLENEYFRLRKRKDSVYITHEILSWHKDDAKNLTLAKMEDMAREYMQQRNPKGMYVAIPHFDKEHFHIHICASGIEYKTGKSMRLSKADLSKLKKGIQVYQIKQYPEMSKSIVEHGKKDKSKSSDKEYQIKFISGRESEKEKVITTIKDCFKNAKSRESLFQLLNDSGLKTYERNGKITGVVSKNYKFRFSRLGFTENRFEELDNVYSRENKINKIRKTKNINLLER